MADKIRMGIVGVGNMGSSHLGMFKAGDWDSAVLTAVCDIKPDRLEFAKKELPELAVFDNYSEMLDSGLIDAVIIATPHYFHPDMVKEALDKGIHAMSEKPAGVYTKAVHELIDYAEDKDAVYAIMFNQRTNPVYRKVKEIVASGKYGELRRVSWIITDWYRSQFYYNSGGWRATWDGEGGGVLMNQAPHNLDLWQWICGMPCKIRAFCHNGKWHDIEVEDDVTIYTEYPNGATGTFVTTTGDCPGSNRLEITLDGARIIVSGSSKIDLYELNGKISEFTKTSTNGFGALEGKHVEVDASPIDKQHATVINAFTGHILNGTPLIAEGKEGIKGLTLCNAAYLSSWLDKTIDLPLDEDLYLDELNKRRSTSKAKKDVVESVNADMSTTF